MDFETLRMLFFAAIFWFQKKKKKWEEFCMYLMISNVNAVCCEGYEWVVHMTIKRTVETSRPFPPRPPNTEYIS